MTFVFVFASVLLIALGVPLWLQKVPPNRLYGFRTPRTLADDRVWYPVNRVAGRNLTLMGAGTLVLGGGLALIGWLFTALLATGLIAAAAVVHSLVYAATYVQELDAKGPRLVLENELSNKLKRGGRTQQKH